LCQGDHKLSCGAQKNSHTGGRGVETAVLHEKNIADASFAQAAVPVEHQSFIRSNAFGLDFGHDIIQEIRRFDLRVQHVVRNPAHGHDGDS